MIPRLPASHRLRQILLAEGHRVLSRLARADGLDPAIEAEIVVDHRWEVCLTVRPAPGREEFASETAEEGPPETARVDEPSASERRILGGMSRRPRTIDQIASAIGRTVTSTLYSQLRDLELRGLIRHRHGEYWIES